MRKGLKIIWLSLSLSSSISAWAVEASPTQNAFAEFPSIHQLCLCEDPKNKEDENCKRLTAEYAQAKIDQAAKDSLQH